MRTDDKSTGVSPVAGERVAFLLTCHNRVAQTLACLSSIYSQQPAMDLEISVFLVDDGSTDGTASAVRKGFPEVHVIPGSGNLYWNGGMRTAFAAVLQTQFTYIFWINDDTELLPGALQVLLETAYSVQRDSGRPSIIVGAACDLASGQLTYGGWMRSSSWNRGAMQRVMPGKGPARCDSFNGNCVLIPEPIARRLGNLDPAFAHSMGDLDYGFRAIRSGFSIWLAPGFVASCRHNSGAGLWSDTTIPLVERWRRMRGPKGLPAAEWLVFTRRHFGVLWFIYWANPYVRFWLRGLLQFLSPLKQMKL